MQDRYQVFCGDFLKVAPRLASNSVDLVLGSPPYEAARTYSIGFKLRGPEWVRWAADRYMECLRISRGLVAWVVEGQTRQFQWSAAPVLLMAELVKRGAVLRKPPAFCRVGIPGSGGPDWLRNDYEFIVCATSGGKLPWSDNTACGHTPKWGPGGEMSNRRPDGARISQWGKNGAARGMGNKNADGTRDTRVRPSNIMRVTRGTGETGEQKPNREVPFPVLANPGNLIRCNVGGGVMGSRLAHENEAPYPEKLAEFFIKSFCPPGGITLDPFAGSGTTAAVALRLGRRAIAVDIRRSQCDLTMRRIREVLDKEKAQAS